MTQELPVIVLGAGGHAKVVIDTLNSLHTNILGLTVRNKVMKGTKVLGVEVLGTDDALEQYPAGTVMLANGIGSVGTLGTRTKLYEHFTDNGYQFMSAVHPRAIVAGDVTIGNGAQVFAGTIIQAGTSIGNNAIIGTNVTIDHDCHIGAHVHVSAGAILCGTASVSRYTHIGAGAIIREGVTIGRNCVVAPGAVVASDVPANTRVAGMPARAVE